VPEATAFPATRPGPLRRAAAGAWHVPAGFAFLLRRPRLWPLALFPLALAAVLITGGLVLGLYVLAPVDAAVAPAPGRVPAWLGLAITLALGAATMAAGAILGLAAALALASPVLDRLSRRVESLVRGAPAPDAGRGLLADVVQSLRGTLYFLVAAPGVAVLCFIPVVGPVAGAFWGAHALALQQTDGPLSRRGLDFRARREWNRRWRAESLGFGLAGLVALLVPLANFLLAPALAVGATLLVLELEEGLTP
jgi:uncharacterized protein involved in cysteine biosynthesis